MAVQLRGERGGIDPFEAERAHQFEQLRHAERRQPQRLQALFFEQRFLQPSDVLRALGRPLRERPGEAGQGVTMQHDHQHLQARVVGKMQVVERERFDARRLRRAQQRDHAALQCQLLRRG